VYEKARTRTRKLIRESDSCDNIEDSGDSSSAVRAEGKREVRRMLN
jgi:hypothetical protein